MPCTIRDASLVTVKNRNIALNSYYNSWSSAVNGTTVVQSLKGPAMNSAEEVSQIAAGCSACFAVSNDARRLAGETYDANRAVYPNNPSAGGASGLTGSS
jgi:hypothetical protein